MAEKLNVLLLQGSAEAADSVQGMLAAVEGPASSIALQRFENLERALTRLSGMPFDAILTDLDLPDSKGLETLARLRTHRGNAPIIVWTAAEDDQLAFNALKEGADEYLVKGDVTAAGLARRLRLAVERRRVKAESQSTGTLPIVLGFVGVKGGPGTSTVALNVAAVLAKQNRSTILLELKPDYGSLSYQLKHSPSANLGSLRALGADKVNEDEITARLCTLPLGLRVLFGPQRPEEFGDLDAATVTALVKAASRMAERVVIDLPSASSGMAQTAIRQCHYVSMVLEREAMGAHTAKVFQQMLHSWGISQLITGAVIVNRTMSPTPMVMTELSAQVGCTVLGSIPPAIDLCGRCHQAGSPAVFLEPESTYSQVLTELTQRLFDQPALRAARTGA